MIEQDIKRIADALEAIAAHVTQGAVNLPVTEAPPAVDPTPKKKTTKAPAVQPETKNVDITLDQVTDALREVVQKKTPAKAKEILNKYGAVKLSELKPDSYAAIYGDLKAAL